MQNSEETYKMIDRHNNYKGFTTTESINAQKVVEFLDIFSLTIIA